MTTAYFDTLYYDHIEGIIDDPVVMDLDGTPNRVLELDKTWQAEVKWKIKSDAPGSHPVDLIDGTWNVKISVESIGAGFEGEVASVDVPVSSFDTSSAAERTWKHTFTIPVGKVSSEAVYQLVTLITYKDPAGNRRAMAGFSDGPLLTFYQD